MRELLEFGLAVIAIVISYKLGQKMAWDEIARNYIAIHKTAVIGPILVKREGNKNGKVQSKRFSKKAHR